MICEYCINLATHVTGDLQHAICNDCRKKLVEPSDSMRLTTLRENLIERARKRVSAFQQFQRKLRKIRADRKGDVDKLLDETMPVIEENIDDTEIALRFDLLRQETSLMQ